MNNQEKKGPVELMAELLANMTIRVTEAERQLAETIEQSNLWFSRYMVKDNELKETEAKLAAEIAEHEKTKEALRLAVKDSLHHRQEGEPENG